MTDKELIQRFFFLKDNIRFLNEQVDEAKEELRDVEQQIVDLMTDRGETGGSYKDEVTGRRRTISVSEHIRPISTFSYTDSEKGEEFLAFLRVIGCEHLTHRTVGESFKAFSSIAKEEIEENDGEIPEHLEPYVKIMREFKVGLRTS